MYKLSKATVEIRGIMLQFAQKGAPHKLLDFPHFIVEVIQTTIIKMSMPTMALKVAQKQDLNAGTGTPVSTLHQYRLAWLENSSMMRSS